MKIKNFVLKLVVILFVALMLLGSQNINAQQKLKKEKEVAKPQPDSTSTAKPCPCSTTINNYYGGGNEGGSYGTFRANPYPYGRSNFRSIAYGAYGGYNYNYHYNYYSRRNFPRVYNYGNYRQYRSSGGNFRGQSRSNSYRGGNRGR